MFDSPLMDWMALALSLIIVGAYEAWHHRQSSQNPHSMSRSAHAQLRRQWVAALSQQPGTEILAVQALRNSLMSSTITASTAAIMLMGGMTLAASNMGMVRALFTQALPADATLKMVLTLLVLATLFATYVCSAMSMRFFNHAGFVMSLPVGSPERAHYQPMCLDYIGRGGVLYGWGLRCFLYIAPLVAGLMLPPAMPAAAIVLVGILRAFDQPGPVQPA